MTQHRIGTREEWLASRLLSSTFLSMTGLTRALEVGGPASAAAARRPTPERGFAGSTPGHNCDERPQTSRGVAVANKDEAEGRIKEAAGDLTGDKDLQREGKVDQTEGKAKDAVDDAGDAVKDALDRD